MVSIIASDEGWAKVTNFLTESTTETVYSDFGWGEIASALGNRVRRADMSAAYAQALLLDARIYLSRWTFVRTTSADIDESAELVATFALGLKLPDAIHLATARRLRLTLVSTDIRQVRAAGSLGIAAINPLHIDGNEP